MVTWPKDEYWKGLEPTETRPEVQASPSPSPSPRWDLLPALCDTAIIVSISRVKRLGVGVLLG